jgi:hypothetical protein
MLLGLLLDFLLFNFLGVNVFGGDDDQIKVLTR